MVELHRLDSGLLPQISMCRLHHSPALTIKKTIALDDSWPPDYRLVTAVIRGIVTQEPTAAFFHCGEGCSAIPVGVVSAALIGSQL